MELITTGNVLDDDEIEALHSAFHYARKRQEIARLCIREALTAPPSHREIHAKNKIEEWGLEGDIERAIFAPEGKVFEIIPKDSEKPAVRAEGISPAISTEGDKGWVAYDRLMDEAHILEDDVVIRIDKLAA